MGDCLESHDSSIVVIEIAADSLDWKNLAENCFQWASENVEWLLLGVLGLTAFVQIRQIVRGLRAKSWPSTQGIIEDSWIDESYDPEDGLTMYKARVKYSYEVGGTRYRGCRIRFGRDGISTSSRRSETRRIANLGKGRGVPVIFHPRRHKLCTLEAGTSFLVVFFALFTTAGAGWFLWLVSKECILDLLGMF